MASFIVFFLLFLLPFCIAPFGITQFENPKVIFAEIGVILLFLVLLFSNRISFRQRRKQVFLFGAVFFVTIIDLFFFKSNISFFGNAFRMQGIFLLWILLLFSFFTGFTSLRADEPLVRLRGNLHKIASPYKIGFAMTRIWWVYAGLLYSELVAMFFLPLNASQRYVGTLGEPNALAAFAIFLWPFGWFAIRRDINVIARSESDLPAGRQAWQSHRGDGIASLSFAMTKRFLLLFPVAILLYLSDSRSGMVAFGIEMLFLLLQNITCTLHKKNLFVKNQNFFCSAVGIDNELRGKKRTSKNFISSQYKLSLLLITVICLIIYLFSYALPFFDKTPYENRVQVWQSAFYAGMMNPGLGQGFGNTETALHNAAAGLDLPIQYYYVDSSHNIFLDWWVQGGVIGLSLLLILVYTAFNSFIAHKNERNIVLLLGMLTVLSFNPSSVVGLLGFWWIIGQGLL